MRSWTKLRMTPPDATIGLGRRVLQRIFGTRKAGEPLPEPVVDAVTNPHDEDCSGGAAASDPQGAGGRLAELRADVRACWPRPG